MKALLPTAILLLAASALAPAPSPAFAGDAEPLDYNRDVRPILSDKCIGCHGPDETNPKAAGLRLDQPETAYALRKKSGNIPIVPGKPGASEAWKRIVSTDPDEVMPPLHSHKTVSPAERAILKRWIEEGAKYAKHWAFVAPARPATPQVKRAGAVKNPIDAFIVAQLEKKGFAPSPEADKATLLRRVSLDLTGLPPTPEELDAFLADASPDAYEKQVERLLASPRFGEKMAAPWLDAARYADSHGYLHNNKRSMWPWRDWVIKSFNDNLPYDRFLTDQVAGDLLPNRTQEQVLATGFNRNHPITTEGGTVAEEYLNEYACDRVQTVGSAVLGLSLGCARCHDHKFDPVTADDFYALKAYFNSSTEKHVENDSAPAFAPLVSAASPLQPGGPKVNVMVMDERPQPVPAFVLTRGEYAHPDPKHPVVRHAPKALNPLPAGAPANRLGLAQWMVAKENPLVARVAVNLWWRQVFGTGIVKTVDDFGLQGEYPSNPQLLDFLACELRDGAADGKAKAWDVKHLWRLMVTSATYRQASARRADLAAVDGDDRLLGWFPRQRLGAEAVRDQALFVSGLLDDKRIGGEPVYPYQPAGLWEERANGPNVNTYSYPTSKGADLYRRSVYTFVNRACPQPSFGLFDAPDRTQCVVVRATTNTPLQALAALNDTQQVEAARVLAARVMAEAQTTPDRLAKLYRRVTGRQLAAQDAKTLESGLAALLARYRAAPKDADLLLAEGASPVPAGADKPELAAWTMVANTVLNLDATLVKD